MKNRNGCFGNAIAVIFKSRGRNKVVRKNDTTQLLAVVVSFFLCPEEQFRSVIIPTFPENEEVFQLQVCQANEQLQAHHSLRQEGDPQDVPAVQVETKRTLLG